MGFLARVLNRILGFGRRKPEYSFVVLFNTFRQILDQNNRVLELIADMGDKLGGEYIFDKQYIISRCGEISDQVYKLIYNLNVLGERRYLALYDAFERIHRQIQEELAGRPTVPESAYVLSLDVITRDFVDEVGNKAANIGEIRNVLKLSTPDGFAITTRAFKEFLEVNEIDKEIAKIIISWDGLDEEYFFDAAQRIRRKLMVGRVPRRIASKIEKMAEDVAERNGLERPFFAVRSSGWLEDSEHSFAGIHKSILNVGKSGLLDAYKTVVASVYSCDAWGYRYNKGIQEHEVMLGVLCQLMLKPLCSGVLYTLHPTQPEKELMLISAHWGLGPAVVDGMTRVDEYRVDRNPPHEVVSMRVVRKEKELTPAEEGGIEWVRVPEERQYESCLHSDQLKRLADTGMLLERYFKRPQDIEWAIDAEGNIYILQARPLAIQRPDVVTSRDLSGLVESSSVIMSGKGTVVQRGVAVGPVFVIDDDTDISRVPHGVVLVTRYTSPRLARVIQKVRAIITDYGSPTGHMATVAREFRVPTIVDTGIATQVLKHGMEITVDATQNVIYEGRIQELCLFELTEESVFEESYEYRLLRRILKRMSPLNLVDPQDRSFSPENCATYHDITRYVHEKAVEEIIRISETYPHEMGSRPKRLDLPIPLGLMLIDIGDGTQSLPEDKSVTLEQIACLPLKALCEGLLIPGMWDTQPVVVDFRSLMSSVTRTFSPSNAGPHQIGRNLVVISKNYMNMNLRLGYHFNIVDAYIVDNPNDNYAYFRFAGGVTDAIRRSRRAACIAEILDHFDFKTETRGDLIVGRVKKLSKEQMGERMKIIGALIGYTRQLDTQMHSDDLVDFFVTQFLERLGKVIQITRKEGGDNGNNGKEDNNSLA
ncbi:MAG: pyruvate, water dikinase [Deltaproteobacteria bacterium]|nr:pyruvate, water dikinase [Deltaproteobacteria bacterium]